MSTLNPWQRNQATPFTQWSESIINNQLMYNSLREINKSYWTLCLQLYHPESRIIYKDPEHHTVYSSTVLECNFRVFGLISTFCYIIWIFIFNTFNKSKDIFHRHNLCNEFINSLWPSVSSAWAVNFWTPIALSVRESNHNNNNVPFLLEIRG